jgi:hypothetical protein
MTNCSLGSKQLVGNFPAACGHTVTKCCSCQKDHCHCKVSDGHGDAKTEPIVSSVECDSGVKVRYIHHNNRVYAVGGVRSENRLQWYAVRTGVTDNRLASATRGGDGSDIEQDDLLSPTILDTEPRLSNEEETRPDHERFQCDAENDVHATKYDIRPSTSEEQECYQTALCPSENCGCQSTTYQPPALPSPSLVTGSSPELTTPFETGMANAKGEYESHLATSRLALEGSLSSVNRSRSVDEKARSDLEKVVETQDQELAVLRQELQTVNRCIGELQEKFQLLACQKKTISTATNHCLSCASNGRHSVSELSAVTSGPIGPVLRHRSTHQAVGPIRCRSAPVSWSRRSVSNGFISTRKWGSSRDYLEQLFDDHQTEVKDGRGGAQTRPLSVVTIPNQDSTCTTSSAVNIRILEVSLDGSYIRLINTSDSQEYELGSHCLQQNIRGHPVAIFRFPLQFTVPRFTVVTVWSECGESHRASRHQPFNLIFNGLSRWISGSHCTTILCRPNGMAVAWWTSGCTVYNTSSSDIADDQPVASSSSDNHHSTTARRAGQRICPRRAQDKPALLERPQRNNSSYEAERETESCLLENVVVEQEVNISELQNSGAVTRRLGSAALPRRFPSTGVAAAKLQRCTAPC